MKRLFCAVVIFAAPHFAFCADAIAGAQAELEAAKKEYADFIKESTAARAELNSKLNSVLDETETVLKEIEAARAAKAELAAIGEKSKFYDECASEAYADMRVFADAFLGFKISVSMPSRSMYEVYGLAADILPKADSFVFDPLALRPSQASLPDGAPILSGSEFRVGGFRYFVGDNISGFLTPDSVIYGEAYGSQIKGFAAGLSDEIPADTSGGILYERRKTERGIAQEISLGGVWMYPILFFGGISLLVCVAKLFSFARIRRAPRGVLSAVFASLEKNDETAALGVADKAGYPYAGLLSELIKSRALGSSMQEEISYESMLLAGEKLFAGLSVLSVSAAVAPLFGLLGTVTGIIKTFGDLSFHGAGQAQFISAGISEALITTEYGLVVAIPAFVAHAILSRRAKAVLADMEKLASGFVSSNKNNG